MKLIDAIAVCAFVLCSNTIVHGNTAVEILDAAGIQGRLIVHLGCGDGRLTAALRAGDNCVVQSLDTDPQHVEAARKHIQSLGIYGKVSADLFDGKQLPYVDNCVNLIVAGDGCEVPRDEMLRALAANGVALVGGKKIVKARPEGMDDWTHFLHAADNNAVAEDTVIDMPYRIRWVGAPKHSRSHHFHSSIATMVSAGGKLFTIIDEGPTWLFNQTPARWSIVARDAFNGVTLWRVPITSWVPVHQGGGGHDGRFMFAPDLFRRLVAIDDRVYTTLSIFGPVSVLDAATGKTIRTYAGTEKTEEIIYHNGVLYCVQTTEDPANIDRRAMGKFIKKPIQFGSSDGFVYALRASDGVLAWKSQAALGDRRLAAHDQLESVWPLHGSTLVEDDAVYVASGRNAYFDQGVCLYKLDLATGRPLVAKRFHGRDPETGRRVDLFTLPMIEGQNRPRMTGLKADVFSSGASSLFLGGVAVARDLKLIGDGEPHLFSHMQLLDAESFERSCWIYGTFLDTGKMGFPIGPGGEIGGVIMAFDDASVYGANDPSSMIGKGVYSASKVLEPVQVEISSRALKRKVMKASQKWRKEDVPVNVRAMVVSDDLLFVAGPERFDEHAVERVLNTIPTSDLKLDPLLADALDTVQGKKGSLVWVMNKADGGKRYLLKLDSAPVFDGMIAADKCLYLSTLDGRVTCLGADR